MEQIIDGIQRNAFPGDCVMVMTRAHTDVSGDTYASRTEYCPLYAGHEMQVVVIAGSRVTFS